MAIIACYRDEFPGFMESIKEQIKQYNFTILVKLFRILE